MLSADCPGVPTRRAEGPSGLPCRTASARKKDPRRRVPRSPCSCCLRSYYLKGTSRICRSTWMGSPQLQKYEMYNSHRAWKVQFDLWIRKWWSTLPLSARPHLKGQRHVFKAFQSCRSIQGLQHSLFPGSGRSPRFLSPPVDAEPVSNGPGIGQDYATQTWCEENRQEDAL